MVSPLATACIRNFGTRTTLLVGVVLEIAAFIGASFAHKLWHLIITQGLCFGWGICFMFVGNVGVSAQWFTTKRSLANATGAAGSGLGGLIYALATQRMIQTIGLSWTFRVLGIVAGVVNFVCAVLTRDRNKSIKPHYSSFDYKLFGNVDFLLLSSWGFLSMLGYTVLLFSLAAYSSAIGLTTHQGSVVAAMLSLGQMIGRPPIGYFSDTMGRINMASTMTFLCGLLCLIVWVFAKSYGVLIMFSLFGGMVAGTFWATVAPVTAEVFDMRELPTVLNLIWLMIVLPTTFAEAIALEIVKFDGGHYLGAQLFTGFVYVGAAVCLWVLRARKLGMAHREEAVEKRELGQPPRLCGYWVYLVRWERV
jgi:MFS family permease